MRDVVSAIGVLRALADGNSRVADQLRFALLLDEVRSASDVATWIRHELNGYEPGSQPPGYRVSRFEVRGDAFNGAWQHGNTRVPLVGLPKNLVSYATQEVPIRQALGSLEEMLVSGEPSFRIPWDTSVITALNGLIARGGTGVDSTYSFHEVWWEVPNGVVVGIVERVRMRLLDEITTNVPPEKRIEEMANSLAPQPLGVHIDGSGNQVMIGSPNASQTAGIVVGDWDAFSGALRSIGIGDRDIDALGASLREEVDEATRVMRMLAWARHTAGELGVGAAASTIATLGLKYLGMV